MVIAMARTATVTTVGLRRYFGSNTRLLRAHATRTISTVGLQPGHNTSRVRINSAINFWLGNGRVAGFAGVLRFGLKSGSTLQYKSIQVSDRFQQYARKVSIALPAKCFKH